MPNVQINYLYRDYANYKNHNEVIFGNPDNLSLAQVESLIKEKLLDGEWFYASKWGLSDLHFEKWDDENDHPYHEFRNVEYTDGLSTETKSITDFLRDIPHQSYITL
jgi:hypothetical protein